MGDDFAEELKTRGNEAFSAKRYEDAIVLYEKASEANPNNVVYHNNRAAAYHELKQYDQAIAAAQKALEVHENAKSHARIASALWAQRKFADARRAYERALSLEPGNSTVRESLQRLQEILSSTPSSATSSQQQQQQQQRTASRHADGMPFTPSSIQRLGGEFATPALHPPQAELLAVVLDVAVMVVGAVAFVSSMVLPMRAAMLWRTLLLLTIAQQLPTMYASGLLRPSLDALQELPRHQASALFSLCAFAMLTGVRIIGFMCLFITMYAVVALCNRRATLRRALPAAVYNLLAPHLDYVEARKHTSLLLAASFESMLIFSIMLSGGAVFTLVYLQYAKYRYCSDGYVQLACHALRLNVSRLTRASWMPPVVDHYAQRFFDLIHTAAVGTP